MVKANELRIGNFVMHNGKNVLVENVVEGGINAYCKEDGEHFECELTAEIGEQELEGVPLTAQLLKDCGFMKASHWVQGVGLSYSYDLEYVTLFINEKIPDGGLLTLTEFFHGMNQRKVEYLHELQNLYHALTGEELTVNLQS